MVKGRGVIHPRLGRLLRQLAVHRPLHRPGVRPVQRAVHQVAVGLGVVGEENSRQGGGGQQGKYPVGSHPLRSFLRQREAHHAQAVAQGAAQGVAEQVVHVGGADGKQGLDALDEQGHPKPDGNCDIPPAEGPGDEGQEHSQRDKHGDVQQVEQPEVEAEHMPRLPEGGEQVGLPHMLPGLTEQHGDGQQSEQVSEKDREEKQPPAEQGFPRAQPVVELDNGNGPHDHAHQGAPKRGKEHPEYQLQKVTHGHRRFPPFGLTVRSSPWNQYTRFPAGIQVGFPKVSLRLS